MHEEFTKLSKLLRQNLVLLHVSNMNLVVSKNRVSYSSVNLKQCFQMMFNNNQQSLTRIFRKLTFKWQNWKKSKPNLKVHIHIQNFPTTSYTKKVVSIMYMDCRAFNNPRHLFCGESPGMLCHATFPCHVQVIFS